MTNDSVIRNALRIYLSGIHAGSDSVLVEELKVARGSSRIDIAVIGALIEGYEIKSDKDTLKRLSKQVKLFGEIADKMTLVVGVRHLHVAMKLIPEWWGVMTFIVDEQEQGTLKLVRPAQPNVGLDKVALLQTLERDEIVSLLTVNGLDKGYRKATYKELAERADKALPIEVINAFVRRVLKTRAIFDAQYLENAFGRRAIVFQGTPGGQI